MIEFLSSWAKSLGVTIVIVSILEMLLPNNKTKKYIRMVMGVYIVFNIISPFVKSKEIFNVNDIDINAYKSTETSSEVDQTSMNDRIEKLYKQELEKDIKNKINEKLDSSKKYLENNSVNYKILLLHEPDYIDDIKDISYDLTLAGHSHNGQVRLPFIGAIYTPKGAKKYYKEYYKVKNTDMYISNGLGTTIMNLRLFNKPSISLYRLTN